MFHILVVSTDEVLAQHFCLLLSTLLVEIPKFMLLRFSMAWGIKFFFICRLPMF